MDARAKTIREILHSSDQYLIPFFQRSYSWEKRHWERLRDDVLALVDDKLSRQHFLGPLVCTPLPHVPGEVSGYQLIDGQQRLTTITLMLAALRDLMDQHDLRNLSEEITEDYLVHKRRTGLSRYKVVPRLGDREALIAVVDQRDMTPYRHLNVGKAMRYFRKELGKDANNLAALFSAITSCLSLVVVTIEDENPYEIFESLNSTGLPLQQSDLIRNYVFMEVPLQEQEQFNKDHWQEFEGLFDKTTTHKEENATTFYRNYLMRDGHYSKASDTFVDFKSESRKRGIAPVDLVAELTTFARDELCFRRPDTIEEPQLRDALTTLSQLEVSTAHPLLMALMRLRREDALDEATLLGCLSDLSSFVIRRSICGESTRAYSRWFPSAIGSLNGSVRECLREVWSHRGWPDDVRFVKQLVEFPLYRKEPKKCRLILDRLEGSYGHKERVDPATLSIEHVMPQTVAEDESGRAWQRMLGENWYATHQQWLHTIGNLTLTGYNPDLSNGAFDDKRALLKQSNLVLNREIGDAVAWTATEIKARAERLAAEVAALWPGPAGTEPPGVDDESGSSGQRMFDIVGLRRLAQRRIEEITQLSFDGDSEARYVSVDGACTLVCLASRPHPQGRCTEYWYGFTPEQGDFLNQTQTALVALSCGSPDRILIFSREEWQPLLDQMNTTDDVEKGQARHWHVQLWWWSSDRIELDQPRDGKRVEVSDHRLEVRSLERLIGV